MRKLFFLIICLITGISYTFAGNHPEAHFGEFGLDYFPNPEGYKQYIGQVVEYLPKEKPSYDDKKFSEIFYGKFNTPYIIKKVSGNEKKIKFEMVEKENPSAKIKFEFMNYPEYYSHGKYTFANTANYRVPLFFPEKFANARSQYKGKTLKAQDNISLTIEDIEMNYPYDSYPSPNYVVTNPLSGKTSSIPMNATERYTNYIGKKYVNTENTITLIVADIKGWNTFSILNPTTGEITDINSYDYDSNDKALEQYAKLYFDAAKNIGKVFSDPECNFTLTITDVKVEKGKYSDKITYSVKDSSSDIIETTSADIDKFVENKFSKAKQGKYIATLKKVVKPSNSSIRYGKTKEVKDNDVTKFSYVDNIIDIIIFATNEQFSFILKNVSSNSIKIIWDEAVFVDAEGATSKVMHVGTRYSERNSSQSPTTIIQNAKVEDVATPTDRVRYSDYLSEWVTDSMFPRQKELSNLQIQLMLPIQIKNVINEYVFVFDLKYISLYPELLKNPHL